MRYFLFGLLLFLSITKSLIPLFNPYIANGDQKQQLFWQKKSWKRFFSQVAKKHYEKALFLFFDGRRSPLLPSAN
jgi:hypothetical protein